MASILCARVNHSGVSRGVKRTDLPSQPAIRRLPGQVTLRPEAASVTAPGVVETDRPGVHHVRQQRRDYVRSTRA